MVIGMFSLILLNLLDVLPKSRKESDRRKDEYLHYLPLNENIFKV